jgi:hypothetical protein
MRQTIGLSVLMCAFLIAVVVRATPQAATPPAGLGGGQAQAPTNLQVLPKTMTQQEVVALMRTFTAGLGVMCDHCHVGTQADRAKDDKPEKATARKMIKMMMAINDDFLKDVGTPPPPGQQKVTCYTCHRGAVKPLTVPGAGGGN